jgi:hypothetical protein
MRSFRARNEIGLVWLPFAVLLISSWLAGGSITRYQQIPFALAPFDFLAGAVLVCGALIGLYEPTRFDAWFRAGPKPTSRDVGQHLFCLLFGALVCYWGAAAFVSGVGV